MTFNAVTVAKQTIRVLPVVAAALAFSTLVPAQSAHAQRNIDFAAATTGLMASPPATVLYSDLTIALTESNLYQTCLLLICYDRGAYIFVTVRNVGSGPSPATTVRVIETGAVGNVPSLAPGSYQRVAFIVKPCGLYTFYVDPDRLIRESGEYNNWVQFSC